MATKKQSRTKSKGAQKKSNSSFLKKTLDFTRNNTLLSVVLAVFILLSGFTAYNLHLDRQNINDMKSLLADFEQLEKDVEEATNEEFYIEASCDSIGGEKFSDNYSCNINLLPANLPQKETHSLIIADIAAITVGFREKCGLLNELGFSGNEDIGNVFICSVDVRPSAEANAEEIFYEYDTTPGSPI